jgi:hypothetical protein
MEPFERIVNLLDQQFPGLFSCKPGQSGAAKGLEVRCSRRNGYAFVFTPSQNGSCLLSLYENDGDTNPEVWGTSGPEEVVQRIEPWAFPPGWTSPRPIDHAEEKTRLEKLAQGLSARQDIPCPRVEPDSTWLHLLTSAGRRRFEDDVASLSPERIVLRFPWDPVGRLDLKTTVLLDTYETTAPAGRDRELCLAAVGPERRRDEQRITIRLIDLIVVNQTHRWEKSLWLWKDVEVPPSEFWGAELVHDSVTKQAPRLGASRTPGPGSRLQHTPESRRASDSLQLLEERRIEEALALFGVSLSRDVHRLLGGERISPPACCAHPDAAWTNLLVGTLRQSAPWLLAKAVLDEAERLRRWAAQKQGRPRRTPDLKLVIFPGQHHSRKASLMLTGDQDGRNPRLMIKATASNARLADTAWKRPIAVDFVRRGVEFPAIRSRSVLAVAQTNR